MTLLALYAAVRGAIYIGLLLLIGSQAARRLVLGSLAGAPAVETPIRLRIDRLVVVLALPLLILVLAHGALQLASLLDPGDAITPGIVRSVLVDTSWGRAWLLQVAAAMVLLAVGRLPLPVLRANAAAGIITAVIVWAQTGMGHAATDKWPRPLGRILDSAHLLGAGIWLGTLGALMLTAIPLLRGNEQLPALARLVRAFSRYARAGVLLVMLSGITAALVYAGSLDLLLAATWGRLLLIKLALMLGVLALGWYNWRIVTPALDQSAPTAQARLRFAIRLELALALAILAMTTLLVVSPLPGES